MLYIGVMSGTSTDGADVILADLAGSMPRTIGFHSEAFPSSLRTELLALNSAGGNEIERGCLAANALANIYASGVAKLLGQTGVSAEDVVALGCHGQTVRHRPELGFTVQLNNPALLAELSGIDVIADFRSRDVAAGGQGAPLAPAFHDGVFRSPLETRVVVNIGGIANITILQKNQPVWGFDCGPGNCLMDAWIAKHLGKQFDENGSWAAQGELLAALYDDLLREEYFVLPPPKSTGRDLFNLDWLAQRLAGNENAIDVQATLLDLTAATITDQIKCLVPDCACVLVCGGGAQNGAMMKRIGQLLPGVNTGKTDSFGVPAQQVEALAFAWLAKQAVDRHALDLRSTTGARRANILGALYPA